jgi:Kef-type K+ transport system membrane component KefB
VLFCSLGLPLSLSLIVQIGGALIGPHALNIISDVHAVQHLAELGVVFLLFNIGLELSLERLQSMAKYVFGMGAAQVSRWCTFCMKQSSDCYNIASGSSEAVCTVAYVSC